MTSQWKYVEDTDGRYVIFDDGTILTSCYRFTHGPHFMRPFKTHNGYHRITLFVRGQHRKFFMHRLVAQAFMSRPSSQHEVNHKNGVKTDNRIENLEWVSKSENSLHAIRSGLQIVKRGTDAPGAKLTEQQVIDLYLARKRGEKNVSISRRTGVNHKTVSDIWLGKRWAWLTRGVAA